MQCRILNRTDRHPSQPQHVMAEVGENASDLPVLALPERGVEAGAVPVEVDHRDLDRPGLIFRQRDPLGQHAEHPLGGVTGDRHAICLGHLGRGVGEALRQFAVVRQEDESLRVPIEPPDAVEAGSEVPCHIPEALPSLGVFHRGEHATGLIVEVGGPPLGGAQRLPLDLHPVMHRVDRHAERRDDPAVHPDHTLADEVLTGPARGDPGTGHQHLEPQASQRETSTSTSMAASSGRAITPMAERAWTPASPRTAPKSSLAPLATLCCS